MAYYNSYSGGLPYISGQDRARRDSRWGMPSHGGQPLYLPQRGYGGGNADAAAGLMPHRGYENTSKPAVQPTLPSTKPFPNRRASITHEFKPNLLQQPQVNRQDNRAAQHRGKDPRDGDNNRAAGNHGGFYSRNLAMGFNDSRMYNNPSVNPYNPPPPHQYNNYNSVNNYNNSMRYEDRVNLGMNAERTRTNPFSFSDVSAQRRVEQKQFQKKPPPSTMKNNNTKATFESQISPSSSTNSQGRWWDTKDSAKNSPSPNLNLKKRETAPKLVDIERKPIKENDLVVTKNQSLEKTSLRGNVKPAKDNEPFVAKTGSKPATSLQKKPFKKVEGITAEKELKNTHIRSNPTKEIEKLVAKKELKATGPTGRRDKEEKRPDNEGGGRIQIQEDHLPQDNQGNSNSDEMEQLAELERISLRKAVMRQKMVYEETTDKDKDKDLEKERKFIKSRQKLEEENAIMDAIDEEGSNTSKSNTREATPEQSPPHGSTPHFNFSGSSSGVGVGEDIDDDDDDDDVFVNDDDEIVMKNDDDDEEEWW